MFSRMRSLKVGHKYTMATFSYQGTPYHIHFLLKELRFAAYQEHDEAYALRYRKIDTKFMGSILLHPGKQFIIWEGIVNPDTQLMVKEVPDGDSGHAFIIKRWRLNSPLYMQRAKNSVVELPLIENFKPPVPDDALFDAHHVVR